MFENRSEGLVVRAQPLEQAEHISRLMVDVRVADGVLLLDADPAWAEAINTVLATKGVRVSELCPIRNSKLEPPTPRAILYHAVSRPANVLQPGWYALVHNGQSDSARSSKSA